MTTQGPTAGPVRIHPPAHLAASTPALGEESSLLRDGGSTLQPGAGPRKGMSGGHTLGPFCFPRRGGPGTANFSSRHHRAVPPVGSPRATKEPRPQLEEQAGDGIGHNRQRGSPSGPVRASAQVSHGGCFRAAAALLPWVPGHVGVPECQMGEDGRGREGRAASPGPGPCP